MVTTALFRTDTVGILVNCRKAFGTTPNGLNVNLSKRLLFQKSTRKSFEDA